MVPAYFPAAHCVHDDDPFVLYWPTSHVPLHDDAFTALEYKPAGHNEHIVDPGPENFPTGHPPHAVADVTLDARPAGHCVHCAASVDGGLYCPTGHTLQELEPALATDPSAHDVQFPAADAALY